MVLKYTRDVSLLNSRFDRIYESSVILTGQVRHNIYEFNHKTAYLICHGLAIGLLTMQLKFAISIYEAPEHNFSVYFKSKKELNYNRFVDSNILGTSRLVHSDLRIYRISFVSS